MDNAPRFLSESDPILKLDEVAEEEKNDATESADGDQKIPEEAAAEMEKEDALELVPYEGETAVVQAVKKERSWKPPMCSDPNEWSEKLSIVNGKFFADADRPTDDGWLFIPSPQTQFAQFYKDIKVDFVREIGDGAICIDWDILEQRGIKHYDPRMCAILHTGRVTNMKEGMLESRKKVLDTMRVLRSKLGVKYDIVDGKLVYSMRDTSLDGEDAPKRSRIRSGAKRKSFIEFNKEGIDQDKLEAAIDFLVSLRSKIRAEAEVEIEAGQPETTSQDP